jgi:polyhydroxyalkanoate synthesis repressor PhaR
MSVIGVGLQAAKLLDGNGDLNDPIAQAPREIQVKQAPLEGENGCFVLHCTQGRGNLRPPGFSRAPNKGHHVADSTGPAEGNAGGADAQGEAVVIKKYANRRLYNTAASSYVTLDHLSEMVREGVDFIVLDAKTGDDITRSVLTQIIFEQESKGQNLLPVKFLRRLIRFYGDQMQGFLPPYLEMSMESFSKAQEKMRENMSRAFGATTPMAAFEEQAQRNMALFQQAISAWAPFAANGMQNFPIPGMPGMPGAKPTAQPASDDADKEEQVAELRRQMEAMQKQLDAMAKR